MTDIDTLRERLVIECQPQSLLTDIEAEEWEKKILEGVGEAFKAEHKSILTTFSVVLSCTRDVRFHFQGNEAETLRLFVETWQKRQTMPPAALWDWRLVMHNKLWTYWFDQYDAAQQLFMPDPALLPGTMLDKNQQKAADDPASPLVAPAAASPGS